ncbi:MAG TPA: Uma2 family endonuclease [Gemmatimonadaceae bacterium]|nr:Uma2 family endonuclease [Gemmatimonadaceae bacterium]
MAMAISFPLYTVDDLQHFPDDGNRYELLDGVLLVTPQAAAVHQVVASRLQWELATALHKPGLAHVVGPGAVVRMPRTQLQPDILVYPARFSPKTDWRKITEHWLAVEILSRSSRVYDREFKRDAYFALGVQQVWLVDWRDQSIEVCTGKGKGRVVRERIRWRAAGTAVTIALDEIFDGIDW